MNTLQGETRLAAESRRVTTLGVYRGKSTVFPDEQQIFEYALYVLLEMTGATHGSIFY